MTVPLWKKGDDAWQRGEIQKASYLYEKSLVREEAPPRVIIFSAILFLILQKKKEAFERLSIVRKWNAFDLTVREIENRADDILEGRLKVFRYPHVLGWCSQEDTLSEEEYRSCFAFIEKTWQEVEELVKRSPAASVVLTEVTTGLTSLSQGGFVLRAILPKIEIARGFWAKGIVAHELAHVMYPSMNLFLTEGLSLWVQEKIGKEDKGWPFDVLGFGQMGEEAVLDEVIEESLVVPKFFTEEAIQSGKALPWYTLAWQWVSLLVEKKGLEKFLDLYELCRYGDREVKEVFVSLYETRDLWLKGERKTTKLFNQQETMIVYTPERMQRLQELELLWKKNHEKEILALLCHEGWSMLNYLWGEVMGEREKHPQYSVFLTCLRKTEEWLKEALKWWPEDASLHCRLADLYGIEIETVPEEKRMSLALLMQKEVKKALEIDPNYEDAMVTLGRILLFTPSIFGGGKEKARKYFREVLKRNPDHGEALAWDGYVDYMEGENQKAREKWMKVLALYPSHLFATRMIERLEKDITRDENNL
ncbi:MAG: tetratricopeptide repeat protein [Brevinematales bacterium]